MRVIDGASCRQEVKMKKLVSLVLIIALMGFAVGCGNAADEGSSQTEGENAQTEVDDTQTEAENTQTEADDTQTESDVDSDSAADPEDPESTSEGENPAGDSPGKDGSVDVDLSALSSTMIYAQVNDMIMEPGNYMGQTVKMNGTFAVYQDESTGSNYYACIIKDATACCAQGIEFELEGEPSYPADYPEEGAEITVVGTFDTYEEAGMEYCTLRNAKVLE